MIIQLLGLARSGKDWTAEQLKTYFESQGKSVEVMSYAGPMKRIVSTMFDISLEQLDNFKNNSDEFSVEVLNNNKFAELHEDKVELETNFRTLLQRFGNNAMKSEFGDDIWTNLMNINVKRSSADIIIISDCRFHVEVKSLDAVTIRVVNSDIVPMLHASETELLSFPTDYTLENTGKSATYDDIAELGQALLKDVK